MNLNSNWLLNPEKKQRMADACVIETASESSYQESMDERE